MKYLIIMSLLSIHPGNWGTSFQSTHEATSLQYLVRQPTVRTEHPPILLMLHGVGSNEKDLFALADRIDGEYLVVSARAPHSYGQQGFGWYKVDFATGKPVIDDAQAEASRKLLIGFIEELVAKYDADAQRVYLMGFSQGAIMSFAVGLTEPEKVAGIATFSGRMMEKTKAGISTNKKALSTLKVFMSHGTQDPVLKYQYALESKKVLEQHGIQPTFVTDQVGHTISSKAFNAFLQWLP